MYEYSPDLTMVEQDYLGEELARAIGPNNIPTLYAPRGTGRNIKPLDWIAWCALDRKIPCRRMTLREFPQLYGTVAVNRHHARFVGERNANKNINFDRDLFVEGRPRSLNAALD